MHNLGFWLRGDCSVYEEWGEEWSCDAVLETFDTIEAMYANVMGQDDMSNAPRAGFNSNVDEVIMQAFLDEGYDESTGRSVGDRMASSVSWTEWSNAINPLPFDRATADGMTFGSSRVTVGKVFIDPLRSLPNFDLKTNAKVMKIIFEDTTATGVTYKNTLTDVEYTLTADETILALGSVTTAQLLLVSGIGPAADLAALGIPVVADLPVGAQYQNHVFNGAMYCSSTVWETPSDAQGTFPPDYLFKGYSTGFPTTTANVWAQATSSVSPGPADYSMSFITNVDYGPFRGFFNVSGYEEICNDVLGMSPVFIIIGVQYAHSRGNVTISSDSMDDYPVWQPGMFSDDKDATILREAFATLRDTLGPLGFVELFPSTTNGMEDYSIYGTSDSFWHDSSTAAIGEVVDSTLKVYGVAGLRIADSSIQPWLANVPPTAIIQATGLMGASIILKDAVKTPTQVESTTSPVPWWYLGEDNGCPVECTETSLAGGGCAIMEALLQGVSSAYDDLMAVALDSCEGLSGCGDQLMYACDLSYSF